MKSIVHIYFLIYLTWFKSFKTVLEGNANIWSLQMFDSCILASRFYSAVESQSDIISHKVSWFMCSLQVGKSQKGIQVKKTLGWVTLQRFSHWKRWTESTFWGHQSFLFSKTNESAGWGRAKVSFYRVRSVFKKKKIKFILYYFVTVIIINILFFNALPHTTKPSVWD